MKKCILLISVLCLLSPLSYGNDREQSGKSFGYNYAIKNYFSKKRWVFLQHKSSPRNLSIYVGSSVFRETKKGILSPLSSFMLGLNQRVKEFPAVADIYLQINMQTSQLETRRATSIEINPRLVLPDVRSGFPFYVGVGGGLGIYPRLIVQDLPSLSFNIQAFTGVRLLDIYQNLGITGELDLKLQSYNLKAYLEVLASIGLVFSF